VSEKMTFDEYEKRSAESDLEEDSSDLMVPLLGLGGEVGTLLSEYKKKRRKDGFAYTGFEETLKIEMGDVLWYLAALARRSGLSFADIAESNLDKTRRRWLGGPDRPRLDFDAEFGDNERLPRNFQVAFAISHDSQLRPHSQMTIMGEEVGDPINDNAREDDYYRFHDVFHLSYAAGLGWSPVFRSLLKRKRKAEKEIDEAEDGARAAATEEAVAALVFNMSQPYNFFEGSEHVDGDILEAVQLLTAKLEVGVASPRDWELAILSGFNVWRELRKNNGGIVEVNLDEGSLRVI
jgi:NTP pyrophosphatase (non-canonical NTP hydrolase)